MKPTIESIGAAISAAANIRDSGDGAAHDLWAAKVALECSSPKRARAELTGARERLINLRRTQTAALANIDDALKSL